MSLRRNTQVRRAFAARLLITCAGLVAGYSVSAQGQVVLDNFTLSNLADDTNLTIDPSNTFNITEDLGRRAGNNLFHSFHTLNIASGETALFSGDPAIASIISRVTGGSASLIDGALRSAIAGAGFWLVNPTGLILGPNSSIDVGGAFNFGSADFITFSNDVQFSAFDESVTLSVASPRDFGFLSDGGGAGILTLDNIELGAAPSPGVESYNGLLYVGREVSVNDSTVRTLGEGVAQGDIEISGGSITIRNSSLTTATSNATNAGAITLTASNIVLVDSSVSSQASSVGSAGDITFSAAENLTISAAQQFDSEIRSDATQSAGGDILLTAGGRFSIRNGLIEASAGAAGDGGDIEVTADEFIIQSTAILARADDGNGGRIDKNVEGLDLVFIMDTQSVINADSASGAAGEININAPDVDLDSALQDQNADIVAPPELAADACSPSASGELSTFVQEDEGGTPMAPDRYLTANAQVAVSAAAAHEIENSDAYTDVLLAAVQSNPGEGCR